MDNRQESDRVKMNELWQQMKSMRKYMIVAAAIFLFGMVLGYLNLYEGLMDSTLNNVRQVLEKVDRGPLSLGWFGFILMNNLSTILYVIFLGVFFAFVPAYFLVINGMMIGYLASHLSGEHAAQRLIVGILPHGILELPAIVIAGAFGIRFGFLLLDVIISLPVAAARSRVRHKLKLFMRSTLTLMVVLFVVLLIAAIIEVTVTPWLLNAIF